MDIADLRVFDPGVRDDRAPAAFQEPTWVFLNRAGDAAWGRVRELIEAWMADVHLDARRDLLGRLRSPADKDFRSAFFELYCHEMLRLAGFHIEPHPHLPRTTRRPDFFAWRSDEQLYLEATLTAPATTDRAAGARLDTLLDEVNRSLKIENFMLGIDITQIGSQSPSTSKLIRELSRWLATLDPDSDYVATKVWQIDEWEFTVEAFPLLPARRGGSGRIIGSVAPKPVGILDETKPIRRRIDEKSSRYGLLDAGLVVAVDSHEPFVDDEDIAAALYGQAAVTYAHVGALATPPPSVIRLPDGLIWSPKGPRRRQLSAVLTTAGLMPWTVASLVPTWWTHPGAAAPLSPVAPIVRVVNLDVDTNRLTHDPAALTATAFFGLDDGWPHFDL